jgi:hypothetical protein
LCFFLATDNPETCLLLLLPIKIINPNATFPDANALALPNQTPSHDSLHQHGPNPAMVTHTRLLTDELQTAIEQYLKHHNLRLIILKATEQNQHLCVLFRAVPELHPFKFKSLQAIFGEFRELVAVAFDYNDLLLV